MTINLNPFDEKSIDAAIKQVQEYLKTLPDKNNRFVMAVAERGAQTAGETYAVATFDSVHRNYAVNPIQEGDGKAAVVATGSDVGFLEFGFGAWQPGWSGNVPYPAHGSLSEKYPDGSPRMVWYYNGKQSTGSPPAEGMLVAMRTMGAEAGDIAKGVFGSD